MMMMMMMMMNALSEAGTATAAFWDRERIELPQSANLSVTCSVEGVDRYDVIRVVHSYGAKTLLLADNDVTGPIFASLPRYNVTYRYGDNTALVTVHITGKDWRTQGVHWPTWCTCTSRRELWCAENPNQFKHYVQLLYTILSNSQLLLIINTLTVIQHFYHIP